MKTEDDLKKMEAASYLLPNPGGEVVRELISELRNTRTDEWIPVEERLPEMDTIVLAFFDTEKDIVSYCENRFLAWDYDLGKYNIPCKPTHWRHLPPAPTEGERK